MNNWELRTELVRGGYWNAAQIKASGEFDPMLALGIWSRMREPNLPKLSKHPRLVNHFALGADPELELRLDGQRISASQVGLHTGLGFGADLSGRQAELRPQASRSALEVVASLLQELRFMVADIQAKGHTRLTLHAPAWNGRDGFGGHVHFGRKRKGLWKQELKALDSVYSWLGGLGVFSLDGIRDRLQAGHYGQPGDYRPQTHGYEYRSFPTWLDSPWLTYFVLTLSKLLVVKPELAEGFRTQAATPSSLGYPKVGEELLKGIFGYFQGMDDDARLALWLISKYGLPRYVGGDIRGRWGLTEQAIKSWKIPSIYPPCIKPDREQVEELFNHLVRQVPLEAGQPKVTWSEAWPKPYFKGILGAQTIHGLIGIGEICWNLCYHRDLPISVGVAGGNWNPGGREGDDLHLSKSLVVHLQEGWEEELRKRVPFVKGIRLFNPERHNVLLGLRLRGNGQIENARKLLTCGVLPIWRVGTETREQAEEFILRNNRGNLEQPKKKPQELWGIRKI